MYAFVYERTYLENYLWGEYPEGESEKKLTMELNGKYCERENDMSPKLYEEGRKTHRSEKLQFKFCSFDEKYNRRRKIDVQKGAQTN